MYIISTLFTFGSYKKNHRNMLCLGSFKVIITEEPTVSFVKVHMYSEFSIQNLKTQISQICIVKSQ